MTQAQALKRIAEINSALLDNQGSQQQLWAEKTAIQAWLQQLGEKS